MTNLRKIILSSTAIFSLTALGLIGEEQKVSPINPIYVGKPVAVKITTEELDKLIASIKDQRLRAAIQAAALQSGADGLHKTVIAAQSSVLKIIEKDPLVMEAALNSIPAETKNKETSPEKASDVGQKSGESISKFELKVSEDTTLASVTLWAGRPYGAKILSTTLTSAIPATDTNTDTSSKYANAALGFPTTGVLNLHVNFLFQGRKAPLSLGSMDDQIFYNDRDRSYDRYYFKWYAPEIVGVTDTGEMLIVPRISSGRFLPYLCNGIGPQLLFRGSASNKASDGKSGDYGVAGDVYAGFGFDGALVGRRKARSVGESIDKPDVYQNGMYRFEFILDAKYVDKTTLKRLYPNTTNFTQWLGNVCGKFELTISEVISINLQASYPIGGSSHFTDKNLFAGISFSR